MIKSAIIQRLKDNHNLIENYVSDILNTKFEQLIINKFNFDFYLNTDYYIYDDKFNIDYDEFDRKLYDIYNVDEVIIPVKNIALQISEQTSLGYYVGKIDIEIICNENTAKIEIDDWNDIYYDMDAEYPKFECPDNIKNDEELILELSNLMYDEIENLKFKNILDMGETHTYYNHFHFIFEDKKDSHDILEIIRRVYEYELEYETDDLWAERPSNHEAIHYECGLEISGLDDNVAILSIWYEDFEDDEEFQKHLSDSIYSTAKSSNLLSPNTLWHNNEYIGEVKIRDDGWLRY